MIGFDEMNSGYRNSKRNRTNRGKKYKFNFARFIGFVAVICAVGLVFAGGFSVIKSVIGTGEKSGNEKLESVHTVAPVEDSTLVNDSGDSKDSSSRTIIETTERYKVVASYPMCDNDYINRSVTDDAKKIVDSFIKSVNFEQESRSEMDMTFETADANERFYTVCFFYTEKKAPSYSVESYVESYIYDKTTGNEIKEHTLFTEGYNNVFNKKLIEYLPTQMDIDESTFEGANFHAEYIMRDDGIDLVYAGQDLGIGNRIVRVSVPIEEIVGFMAEEYRTGSYDVEPVMPVVPIDVDTTKKYIAFTFDDGPNGATTERIVNALKEYDARATFFVVGDRIKSEKQIAAVNAAVEAGCEIGNHTYEHTDLRKLSGSEIDNVIEKCNDSIENAAGVRAALVRPPGGGINDSVRSNVDYPMVDWDVDTRDWESRNKDKVVAHIKGDIQDGSIVLMHDLYATTADAVEEVLPWLYENGYVVVTVSELMAIKGVKMEDGKVYTSARVNNS